MNPPENLSQHMIHAIERFGYAVLANDERSQASIRVEIHELWDAFLDRAKRDMAASMKGE